MIPFVARLRALSQSHPYRTSSIPYASMAAAYLMLRITALVHRVTIVFLLVGVVVVLALGCLAGAVAYRAGRPIFSRVLAFIGAAICGFYVAAFLFIGPLGTR